MPQGRWKGILGVMAVVAALALVGALVLARRERPYDSSFDTRVASPAYRSERPVVLYDEAHLNTHTTEGGYKPFADLIRNDGYDVRPTRDTISAGRLAGVTVLVIVGALGTNDANDAPAFSDSESTVIDRWVRAGGSLFLVTDHWPYGPAAESLVLGFGVRMGKGLVEDPEHCDPSRGASHLVFSRENGLLADHPIVRGRNSSERIDRVLTFTGQSIQGPPQAVAFMALSDSAVERPPTVPTVEKRNGDVRVSMEYGDPVAAVGRAQGMALEVGRGRVVILGESGMLRAQRDSQGTLVGMNVPRYDNRQLALNIMHWLSLVL